MMVMKTLAKVGFVCVALLWAGTAQAQGISGSAHDFTSKTWNSDGELCQPCHVPHNANTSVTDSPLWSRSALTTETFTAYSSGSLQATVGQPDGTSKLCLSCHDGTVALESFPGGGTGTTYQDDFGTDLSGEHPISFTYDAALAASDGELFDPSTANSGLGGTIDADMLIGGKMECATCHDVHDAAGNGKLLMKANTGSALCITCHDK